MNRPRFDLEETNEPAGADLLDRLILALVAVQWPHCLLAALAGFLAGALFFYAIT